MSEQSRAVLKSYFETGDNPTEAEFINLIDSLYNFTDDDTADMGVDTYVFMKSGNTAENDNGNWRMRVDSGSGNLITEKRKAGVWVTTGEEVF